MTRKFEFNWRNTIAEELLQGDVFERWTEEKDSYDFEAACTFKVDEYGFFLYWKSEGKDGDVLELSQVSDIRYGGVPLNPKLIKELGKKHDAASLDAKSLTIASGLDLVNLNYTHVVCSSAEVAKKWQVGLRAVTNKNKIINVCPTTLLMKQWMRIKFCCDVGGQVMVKTIAKTFAAGKTEKLVSQALAEVELPSEKGDKIDQEAFVFDKFLKVYNFVCPRNDIEELFQSITKGKSDAIGCPQFIDFLNDSQRDPRLNEILFPFYNEKRVTQIVEEHEPDKANRARRRMSKEAFIHYLMSDDNAPVWLENLDIYQEMNHDLNHYYINSSHNTYLSGKQFGGKSTAEMYRQTLLAGCRCVELDCWDGKGPDEEPIITHGKAMCTDILFKEAIVAIADCAFVTSEYPVILSFENHCCRAQQYKLAKYSEEMFGEFLGKECLPGYPCEPGAALPAPILLKHKILIKNKRLKPDVEKAELDLFRSGQFVLGADEEKEDASAPSNAAPQAAKEGEPAPGGEGGEGGEVPVNYSSSTAAVHPLLSSFINYAQPVKFVSFEYAIEKNVHHNMSSFSETAGLNYLKTSAIEFLNYNKRQMSRIYPKGTRADSSNYMPQAFWNSGCQLVSLNFQTPDLPFQLNQGKFEYNGNCGYLLKPDFMRRPERAFDPFAESAIDGILAATCNVTVIAGQFLSDKKVGTYVEVDMYGLPADTIRKEFRTRMVPGNGLNPIYNEDPFSFRKIILPDLAVLRFGVYDENGKLLGQRILPLDGLQAGYRHISLRTEANFPQSLSMLFCCIELKQYVPEGLGGLMDALSNPNAFASGQKQKDEKMKELGIEESAQSKAATTGGKVKDEEVKREELKFDPINVETLRKDKGFIKANKKGTKDLEAMQKKQLKEKETMMKNHCSAIEKIAKGKKKEDVIADAGIKAMVTEQAKEWTDLITRQMKEDATLNSEQLSGQLDMLKAAGEALQLAQIKTLETHFEKENKDMKARQGKVAVDTAKEVNGDKTIKNKADKDRRLREKMQNNTKKFMEERKTMAIKQGREKEKLTAAHTKQLSSLTEDIKMTIDNYKFDEEERTKLKPWEFYC